MSRSISIPGHVKDKFQKKCISMNKSMSSVLDDLINKHIDKVEKNKKRK